MYISGTSPLCPPGSPEVEVASEKGMSWGAGQEAHAIGVGPAYSYALLMSAYWPE